MSIIDKITILSGINKSGEKEEFDKLEIKKGEVIAIVGATGAGKSQLLYDIEKISQRDTKSKRKILVNDRSPDRQLRFDPKKKMIASLAQSMNFLTDMSVQNFLELHLESRGGEKDQELVDEVIRKANDITGEAISSDMNLLNLSGGQSRALMVSDVANISISPIILIDEIENAGIKKEQAIKTLVEEDKIVLIVTHDPSLALRANKRIVIKNGGITNILKRTERELELSKYINWIEGHNLEVREEIRRGKEIKKINLNCK